MRLHALLFCHRNVQIQDLQQKICDADQGKGLKIKLYTVHSHSCNLNWLRTVLLLVYMVTESEVWLVACAEQHKMCSVGAGRVFGVNDDSGCHVKAASILHAQNGNCFSTEKKEKWERVKNAISLRVSCHVCCNVRVKNAISLRVSCHVCCNVLTESKGGKSMWESLHTMMEAKCALKWLLEQVTPSKPWLKTSLFKSAI